MALPASLHATWFGFGARARLGALEEESDPARRGDLAAEALQWTAEALAILPENAESLWLFDHDVFGKARHECLFARAVSMEFHTPPDVAGALACLDMIAGEVAEFTPAGHYWILKCRTMTARLRERLSR